uniref:NADH-ubiquinone oxidoreductase chain 3 n=1 Tax=Vasdavidius concursus TaxID=290153 RepID=Q68PI8_9HEMI|nr:NADH dehydrogenase subunit 3 [Vasdavidius concursus]
MVSNLLIMLIMNFLILILLSIMMMVFSFKTKLSREKQSMFECGFDYMMNLRMPLCIHFYMISIIFLIFDVELMMILPFIFSFKIMTINLVMKIFLTFMLIMMIGLLYEWLMGMINWLI